jgi:hypothetical protein
VSSSNNSCLEQSSPKCCEWKEVMDTNYRMVLKVMKYTLQVRNGTYNNTERCKEKQPSFPCLRSRARRVIWLMVLIRGKRISPKVCHCRLGNPIFPWRGTFFPTREFSPAPSPDKDPFRARQTPAPAAFSKTDQE